MNRFSIALPMAFLLGTTQTVGAWDLKNLKDVNPDAVISGGQKIAKAVMPISDADEVLIGEPVAQEMAKKFGLVQDEKKLAYLNTVGQALVEKCSRKNIRYQFSILKSNDINAFAAPGGFIFVTQGLLDFVKDEGELAGVLGHEIAHVTQRHVVKSIQKSNLLMAGADFSTMLQDYPQVRAKVTQYTMDLLLKGLSRSDELESDRVGTVLSSKTGYTPVAMRDAIARLGEMEGQSTIVQRLNRTHPPVKDRVKAIEDAIQKEKLSKTGQRNKQRFEENLRGA